MQKLQRVFFGLGLAERQIFQNTEQNYEKMLGILILHIEDFKI